MRAAVVAFLLVPLLAAAQTPCALANYGPNDGGWIGPVTRVDCTCSDCPMVRLELRTAAGTYGGAGSADITQRNHDTSFYAPISHRVDYRWRATPLQADGGALPTSVEGAALGDALAPSEPVITSVDVDGGWFTINFVESTEDGSGLEGYKLRFATVDRPMLWSVVGSGSASPSVGVLGPGDWLVGLLAKDAVDNLSNVAWWPTTITTVASPTLPAPSAPVLTSPRYTTNGNLALRQDGTGEEYFFRLERASGGDFHVCFSNSLSMGASTIAYGFSGLEGEFLIRSSQRVGSAVSDWSAATPVAIDHTPPSAPGTASGQQVAGDVVLTWSAATDNIGVGNYLIERNDGVSHTVSGLTLTDPAPPVATFEYRVAAIDLAGQQGPWSNTVTVTVQPFDAGVSTDAGVDAGTLVVDGGSTPEVGPYAVGCACSEVPPSLVLVLLCALARRRTRHSHAGC